MAKHALAFIDSATRTDFFRVPPQSIIVREGFNPRKVFELDELKASIRENGFYEYEPIAVKKVIAEDGSASIVLFNGERRLRSVMELIAEGVDIPTVPVKLGGKTMSDSEQLVAAIQCNTGVPLDCFEEGEAFKRLVGYGFKVKEICRRTGKSDVHIYNRLTLADSAAEVQDAVRSGKMPISRAVEIVRTTGGDTERQKKKTSIPAVKPLSLQWDRRKETVKSKHPTHENPAAVKSVETAIKKDMFSDVFAGFLVRNGFDPNTLKVTVKPFMDADGGM